MEFCRYTNNDISPRKIVIWLAETGARDFIPRMSQAISLWEESVKIISVVVEGCNRELLKKLSKLILFNIFGLNQSCL